MFFTKQKIAGKPKSQAITIPAKSPPLIPPFTKVFLCVISITLKKNQKLLENVIFNYNKKNSKLPLEQSSP